MRYHILPFDKLETFCREIQSRIKNVPTVYKLTAESSEEEFEKKAKELRNSAKDFNEIAIKASERDETEETEEREERKRKGKTKKEKQTKSRMHTKEDFESACRIYYLYDKENLQQLVQKLNEGDTVVLHGEGTPFMIGLIAPSVYDLDAVEFARLIQDAKFPDGINIELYACSSALNFNQDDYSFNFARDTSEALYHLCGYKNIHVSGFAALVYDKENGKFGASQTVDGKKIIRLDTVRASYLNGEPDSDSPDITTPLSYSWATDYIEKAKRGKNELAEAKQQLLSSNTPELKDSIAAHSIFQAPSDSEEEPISPKPST